MSESHDNNSSGNGTSKVTRDRAAAEPERAARDEALWDDDSRHKAIDRQLMVRLWGYLLPYKRSAITCVAISMVVAGLKIAQPIIVFRILDKELPAGDSAGIAAMAMLFGAVITLVLGLEVLFNYMTGVLGQRSMHGLRMAIFRHVNSLDVAFFDRTPVGRLITRMTSDVATLNEVFATGVISIFAETLMIGGLLVIMMVVDFRLSLLVIATLPAMIATSMIFRGHARKWYLEARHKLAVVNTYLQENIAGMQTVQSFNREARNMEAFSAMNEDYKAAQVQTILGFAMFYPVLNLILYLTLTGVIWFGGREVIEQSVLGGASLQFGKLFLFVQCVNMLFTPLRVLSDKYNVLQSAMASSARIFRLLDHRSAIVAPEDPVPLATLRDRIRVDHVDFEYVAGEPVLRDVSFEIERGKTVAVVGATGSGKTTLINLLTRLYDVSGGKIELDGVDIRRFEPRELRRLFAVVQQEVILFSDTVAGNIRFANPDLSDEDVWEILRQVRADDFVRALPEGIDSMVAERGGTFSTGQKQLLAFARALAADPQILILDEATANVDTATEQKIQGAIDRLLRGRTALVIAHRISTIQRADMILVMHKGEIRESGTHSELIEADGLYRRLYELQFGNETQDEPSLVRASS